jgi:glycosyltransferase involved in cell wall biosynthesis
MINVAIDTGNAPPKTGIGIYGQCLIAALSQYGSRDLCVSEAGVSLASKKLRPLRRIIYTIRLYKLANRKFNGADIVHFTNQYVPKKVQGVSYVTTIHDLDPMMLPETHSRRYNTYFELVMKKAIKRIDHIEVHTHAVLNDVLDTFNVPPELCSVVGDGLSDDFFALADTMVSAIPSVPTLLYVGQISKKKNVAWLVKTVAAGIKSGGLPKMKLIVAGGPGYGANDFRNELDCSGNNVEWVQSPSFFEIIRLYKNCSAVVLPSLREGFGRPLLEAMYCDKPIIASKIPSNLEVGGQGENYFQLGNIDEFYQCVNNAFLDIHKEKRRENAQKQLARYSWENLTKLYVELYKKSISTQDHTKYF